MHSESSTDLSETSATDGATDSHLVVDTLIISDIHLGSDVCRSDEVLAMLKKYRYNRLVLNGDVFDDLNFKRLRKSDWRFLSYVRRLAAPKRNCQVVWVAGNHDGVAEILSHLLGVEVYDEFMWSFEGRTYLAIHGHQFDRFLYENVIISNIASWVYLWMQKLSGKNQWLSRWVKKRSKSWLRLSEKIARDAVNYGRQKGADVVFCGHTHLALTITNGPIAYYNSGCWTDKPSQFITVDSERGVRVEHWE